MEKKMTATETDLAELHQFAEGDLVREKGGTTVYELQDVNPSTAEERKAADESWGYGMSEYGGSRDWYSPDEIELVLSASAAAKRTIPALDEIAGQVASTLHGGLDEFVHVTETDAVHSGSFEAYGTTSDGLTVSFTVTVSHVTRAD